MIRYDPTQVDLTSNFFVLCTNGKVYLYNYSSWVELSMNIHKGMDYYKAPDKSVYWKTFLFGLILYVPSTIFQL